MSTLVPCPSCRRHARVAAEVCPFCGESLDGLTAPTVRTVSRRELTRAAVFGGAALLLGLGCQREEPETDRQDGSGSGGGERLSDGEPTDFSADRDTGDGRDTRVTRTDDERRAAELRRAQLRQAQEHEDQQRLAQEREAQLLRQQQEERRRLEEENLDRRRDRRHQGCQEPACMAMPYGAPPARDHLV